MAQISALIGIHSFYFIIFNFLIFLYHFRYMQREFLIAACSIIFILPMCFSVRIDFLKYVSPVGVLAIVYVVSLIAYEYFHGDYVPGPIKQHPDKWTDVFLVVPVICFGYQVIYRRLH